MISIGIISNSNAGIFLFFIKIQHEDQAHLAFGTLNNAADATEANASEAIDNTGVPLSGPLENVEIYFSKN